MRQTFLKRHFIGCCFLTAVMFGNFLASAQSKPEDAASSRSQNAVRLFAAQQELETRREIFEQVWRTINDNYYDAKFNGTDWRAARLRFRPLIEKAANDAEFYAILDQMAGELNDSHTRVYSAAQRDTARRLSANAGIVIGEIQSLPVVVKVAPGSDAEQQGIKPGMIVRSVNNQAIGDAIAEARKSIGASSSPRAAQMRVFSRILAGEPDSPLILNLSDSVGSKGRRFHLRRGSAPAAAPVEWRLLPANIAYLKFPRFTEELEKEIETRLVEFKDTAALILDLRDHRGGDGEVGLRFAAHFFRQEITVARLVTRNNLPPAPDVPMTLKTGGSLARIYEKPVVVLINEGTASTAELIANAFQEQKRAPIFGGQSCGCVLGILAPRPLIGGELTLSDFGFITAKNKKLEGSGVLPDRIVPPQIKDLRENRDETLRQAEKYLAKHISERFGK
jgi:carboxyl-terminal processing protease